MEAHPHAPVRLLTVSLTLLELAFLHGSGGPQAVRSLTGATSGDMITPSSKTPRPPGLDDTGQLTNAIFEWIETFYDSSGDTPPSATCAQSITRPFT